MIYIGFGGSDIHIHRNSDYKIVHYHSESERDLEPAYECVEPGDIVIFMGKTCRVKEVSDPLIVIALVGVDDEWAIQIDEMSFDI